MFPQTPDLLIIVVNSLDPGPACSGFTLSLVVFLRKISEKLLYKKIRLAPVLKTIFHLCVMSYTCSQSNSDGSVLEPSELGWLQVYDMTH